MLQQGCFNLLSSYHALDKVKLGSSRLFYENACALFIEQTFMKVKLLEKGYLAINNRGSW